MQLEHNSFVGFPKLEIPGYCTFQRATPSNSPSRAQGKADLFLTATGSESLLLWETLSLLTPPDLPAGRMNPSPKDTPQLTDTKPPHLPWHCIFCNRVFCCLFYVATLAHSSNTTWRTDSPLSFLWGAGKGEGITQVAPTCYLVWQM